jgi:cytochrome c oxidase subunit 1
MASTTYPLDEEQKRERTVSLPALLHDWVITVDHKRLGIMYTITALFFFVIAGILAAAMRLQLLVPNGTLLAPEVFNRMFTMHGTTMVFFVGMPFFAAFANYLVPLMVGTRDMAFPRLNAFGFWMTVFAGVFLYASYLTGEGLAGHGTAPDVGWFAYSPLTERAFSRGTSTDYWILSIILTGVGSTITAINVLATALCLRTKGMTLTRMPLMVGCCAWSHFRFFWPCHR